MSYCCNHFCMNQAKENGDIGKNLRHLLLSGIGYNIQTATHINIFNEGSILNYLHLLKFGNCVPNFIPISSFFSPCSLPRLMSCSALMPHQACMYRHCASSPSYCNSPLTCLLLVISSSSVSHCLLFPESFYVTAPNHIYLTQ